MCIGTGAGRAGVGQQPGLPVKPQAPDESESGDPRPGGRGGLRACHTVPNVIRVDLPTNTAARPPRHWRGHRMSQ